MRLLQRSKLVAQRFKKISREEFLEIKKRWQEECQQRYHLISLNSIIGDHFNWDLKRIAQWVSEKGFCGVEIRVQDLTGFAKKKSKFNTKINFKSLKKNIDLFKKITFHLSDWASWVNFYKGRFKELKEVFYTKENIRKYFGGLSQKVLIERLLEEISCALQLGCENIVFHAIQIDYDQILFGAKSNSQKEVINTISDLLNETLGKLAKKHIQTRHRLVAGLPAKLCFCLENGSAIDQGVLRLRDYKKIFQNVLYPEALGITLDLSHLVSVIAKQEGKEDIENKILKELRQSRALLDKIKIIHFSDTILEDQKISDLFTKKELSCAKSDFWCKRGLIRDDLINDHIPFGFTINNPKKIVDFIEENRKSRVKLILVHELKTANFESQEMAYEVQKAAFLKR